MNTCKQCGVYTRGDNLICYGCGIKGNYSLDEFKNWSYEKPYLNYIKGHIGEALIQDLFAGMGYLVFRYGVENALTYIHEYLDQSDFSPTELSILKSRPDLLVLNKEKKKPYFIEVKYTHDGKFSYKNLKEDYKYHNTYIVILSKKGFKCLRASELKKITQDELDTAKYDLAQNEDFNLDKGYVKLMEEQATNIYEAIGEISHVVTS